MAQDPATVAHRWFNEVWNEGSESTMNELAAPGVIGHGLGEGGSTMIGPEHFHIFWRNLRTALPDLNIRIEDTITQGDKVVVRIVLDATHLGDGLGVPPSKARVSVGGIVILRVVDGQIAEAWNNWDQLTLLQQIHAIPSSKPADRFLTSNL